MKALALLIVLAPLGVVILAGDWIATGMVAALYLVLGIHGARPLWPVPPAWFEEWGDTAR